MTDVNYEAFEPIIGLEIHVQLNTKTKLFGRTRNHFGDEPNTNIDEVDTGQPGALPVLNKEAVKKAVQFGLAIHADISRFSTFDRKSYFYPDAPRNFQITQFYNPIMRGGVITCDVDGHTKHFKINRAHLEDDSGMLKHFTSFAGVDFNRAGIPLLEIVSEPMMRSPKEASAYATSVRAILHYLDASDCNMEEGSLRIDANVSVRLRGETGYRPKIEIKNMNSFHNMELALESEIRRQILAYSRQPHEKWEKVVETGTYRFDLATKQTRIMRKKESAEEYRYVYEPDLVPIVLSEEYIETIRATLPELPHERYLRYISTFKIAPDSAALLINDKFLSDFFEDALKYTKNPSSLCSWLTVEFAGRLKEKGRTLKKSGLQSKYIGKLVNMIEEGKITGKIAKLVADEMMENPHKDSEDIVRGNPDYQPLDDASALEVIVDQVLANNPQSIADFKQGKTKAFGFLVGQVMQETKGKASPPIVNELLKKKIDQF